jgi:hypothetical protein
VLLLVCLGGESPGCLGYHGCFDYHGYFPYYGYVDNYKLILTSSTSLVSFAKAKGQFLVKAPELLLLRTLPNLLHLLRSKPCFASTLDKAVIIHFLGTHTLYKADNIAKSNTVDNLL